jgi:hypothetical protein
MPTRTLKKKPTSFVMVAKAPHTIQLGDTMRELVIPIDDDNSAHVYVDKDAVAALERTLKSTPVRFVPAEFGATA